RHQLRACRRVGSAEGDLPNVRRGDGVDRPLPDVQDGQVQPIARRQRWRVRLVFEGDARGQVDPNTVDVVSAGADGDRAAVGADLEAGVAFGRAGPADDVDPGLASVEQLDVRLLVQVGV